MRRWARLTAGPMPDWCAKDCGCGRRSENRYPQTYHWQPIFTQQTFCDPNVSPGWVRLHADPIGMVKRLADLCEVDTERLQLWTFARAAADPRPDWSNTLWVDIARALAP